MNRAVTDPARTGRQLDLCFSAGPDGATYLSRQAVGFPFHMTRPFDLDRAPAGMATVILQSVGAGIVQGDRIGVEVEAAENAAAHLTSQASTVVHSMTGGEATQTARVVARRGAFLEHLPDALILFPGSRLTTHLELVVEPGATLLWCDGYIMHDPKEEGRRFSHLSAETVLRQGEDVVAIDRFRIDGDAMDSDGGAVTSGFSIHASFGVVAETDLRALIDGLRGAAKGVKDAYIGVSMLPEDAGIWCRLLARDGVAYRKGLDALWHTARVHLTGHTPGSRGK